MRSVKMVRTLGSLLISATICLTVRSEEHTSELQSRLHLVCRLLLEKKKKKVRDVGAVTEEVAIQRNKRKKAKSYIHDYDGSYNGGGAICVSIAHDTMRTLVRTLCDI